MTQLRHALAVAGLLLAFGAGAQMTVEQAREEGKAMAQAKRADPTLVPAGEERAAGVPGFGGTALPQATLFDDPDRLVAEGAAAARASDSYRTVTDPAHARAIFGVEDIRTTTARARAVESDPTTYLAGEAISASKGGCRPLPPSAGGPGWYEATCNTGTKVDETSPSCRVPLVVKTELRQQWRYICRTGRYPRDGYRGSACGPFEPLVDGGACHETGRVQVGMTCLQYNGRYCTEPGDPIHEVTLSCAQPVPGQNGVEIREAVVVGEQLDETQCLAATGGQTCQLDAETCVGDTPQTRLVDGIPVTRPCWEWQRNYVCRRLEPGNDCGALEANRQCSFVRTECLDDPPNGPCKVSERIYRCPVPGAPGTGAPQFICGGDVYCLNGTCEPIVREASTEFKDALVALHAIGQAGRELDPAALTVFSGERDTCHKPVFGLVNCCAGKTTGLLTAAAGGAALAGGPAAIAALATPFLTMFLCGQDEMRLDIKDRMGFCHKVGTYCSKSVLGICTTKRTAYCCFESKLSRILQEQGRPQLGKAWGAPKSEACRGFTIEEFARLDLSRMDFTEVYAEFLEAAKLPDEAQALADAQNKIREYYAVHGRR